MNDNEFSDFLRKRLPRRTAPASLRYRLERRHVRRARPLNVAIAFVVLAFVAAVFLLGRRGSRNPDVPISPLVAEAVSDHLRVLYAEHPIEIESGGIHQVKPWFLGRLDFAPIVSFDGSDEFPLQGGSVAYFIDRKAAAFVYKRRLHLITLLVFREAGLPWPSERIVSESRGFHIIVWRQGELGYALVSDVDAAELASLERKLKGE